MKCIILDTETTGLSNADELIEITLILAEYDEKTEILSRIDEYSGLRYPNCSVSRKATAIQGLTKRKLNSCELDLQRIKDFFEQADFVVCHNVQFDIRFVVKIHVPSAQKNWFCTMDGIPWKNFGFSNCKLHDLLSTHDINIEQAHRAMSDANGLFSLLQKTNIRTGKSYFATLIESEPFTIDLNITYASSKAKERYGDI